MELQGNHLINNLIVHEETNDNILMLRSIMIKFYEYFKV